MARKKISFEFNPFEETGVNVPRDKRADALADVQAYVKEQVLKSVGGSSSPVEGGDWSPLSKEYAAIKKKKAGNRKANLELSGDMLDALDVVAKNSVKLSLQIAGAEAPKADGHNNFSGKSQLPQRNFIPDADRGQTFKKSIWDGVKNILEGYEDDSAGGDNG